MPLARKPSTRRQALLGEESTGQTVFNTNVRDFYKVNMFYPALDKVITELNTRFSENNNIVLSSLSSVIFDTDPSDESFKTLSEYYQLDKDLLKAEQKLFNHVKKSQIRDGAASPEIFKLMVENETVALIPELTKAVKIYTVIPTSCSAECNGTGEIV